jgi:hypothetical protein
MAKNHLQQPVLLQIVFQIVEPRLSNHWITGINIVYGQEGDGIELVIWLPGKMGDRW